MCNAALCGGEAGNVLSLEKGQLRDETTLLADAMPQGSFYYSVSYSHPLERETVAVFSDMISVNCAVYFEDMKNIFSLESQTFTWSKSLLHISLYQQLSHRHIMTVHNRWLF